MHVSCFTHIYYQADNSSNGKVKDFAKMALSGTIFEIQAFLKKTLKFKMAAILASKYLLKLGKARLHIYPPSQIFCRNHPIWHDF